MNKALLSSNCYDWETPYDLFAVLDDEFHFTLDPCCLPETAKCQKFYTKFDDGLSKSWKGEIVFCNPPYGRGIRDWIRKCYEESKHAKVVMLIPARTDTRAFHQYIYHKAEIRFLPGRIHFRLNGFDLGRAPFPVMIVIF